MENEFRIEELLMIRGVIKSYLKEREGLDEYEGHKSMKEDLETILDKIECNLNHNILNDK